MRTRPAHSTCSLLLLLTLGLSGTVNLLVRDAHAGTERFVRVKVDVANLRQRPSRQAKLVRRAYENEPLRVVGSNGEWLEVRDLADQPSWINDALTDGRRTVVVIRDLVNARESPGTENPVVFTAERGVNLLVLDRSGRWLRVRHEVGEGWIHDSLVWGPP